MNAPLLEEIDAAGDVSVLRLNHPVLDAEALHTICEQLALHTQLLAVGGGLRLCGSDGCIDIDRLGVVMSEG
jgi:hypothetical protein